MDYLAFLGTGVAVILLFVCLSNLGSIHREVLNLHRSVQQLRLELAQSVHPGNLATNRSETGQADDEQNHRHANSKKREIIHGYSFTWPLKTAIKSSISKEAPTLRRSWVSSR